MFLNITSKSSFLVHRLPKQSKLLRRTMSLLPIKRKPVLINRSQFRIVYDFPYMRYPVAVVKSRISIPLLYAIGGCYIYISYENLLSALVCLVPGCIHSLIAFVFSLAAKNIVGKVYVNKEGEVSDVLFSSMDRFGNRIDRIHKIDELLNCDYPSSFYRKLGFIKIGINKSDLSYKLNVRDCKLIDPEVCGYLFGRLWKIEALKGNSTDKNNVDDKKVSEIKEKS